MVVMGMLVLRATSHRAQRAEKHTSALASGKKRRSAVLASSKKVARRCLRGVVVCRG